MGFWEVQGELVYDYTMLNKVRQGSQQ